nr:unnamed protein product [Digitaria exilis]
MNNSESADIYTHAATPNKRPTNQRTHRLRNRTEASRSGSRGRTGGGGRGRVVGVRPRRRAGESAARLDRQCGGPPSPRLRRGTLGERAEGGGGGGGGGLPTRAPGMPVFIGERVKLVGGDERHGKAREGEKRSQAQRSAGGQGKRGGRALNQFSRVYKSSTPLRRSPSLADEWGWGSARPFSLTDEWAHAVTTVAGAHETRDRDGTRTLESYAATQRLFPLVPVASDGFVSSISRAMHADAMVVSPQVTNQSVMCMVDEGDSEQASAHFRKQESFCARAHATTVTSRLQQASEATLAAGPRQQMEQPILATRTFSDLKIMSQRVESTDTYSDPGLPVLFVWLPAQWQANPQQ